MITRIPYHHIFVEGTSYHVGQLQGAFLTQVGRTLISYEPPEPDQTAREMQHVYDEYCPGLTEEIQGVADSLGLPFAKALFCAVVGPPVHGCTHALALPAITADHHLLVARNYDMAVADADLCLCTTRIAGKRTHVGFSDMGYGRLDGINQHGLCVTLSNVWDVLPDAWRVPHGVHYAVAVRAALEHCTTLDDAVDLWQRMPIGNPGTFLAADPSGHAACIEIAGGKRAVKRIGPDTDEQHLVATNHYTLLTLPGAEAHHPNPHSTRRYAVVTSWLQEHRGQITVDGFKAFLDRDWATGVSSYSPEYQAGTLWSMVFDVTAGTVDIRFGPPPYNQWRTFALDGQVGVREYTAEFPA